MPSPTVLLVDDDNAVREGMARMLRRWGYHVHQAADGTSALAELERAPVDAAVVDYHMPDMDGLTLLSLVRTHWPTTGRVLMSGVLPAEIAQGLSANADPSAILGKPVASWELRSAVHGAANRPQDE